MPGAYGGGPSFDQTAKATVNLSWTKTYQDILPTRSPFLNSLKALKCSLQVGGSWILWIGASRGHHTVDNGRKNVSNRVFVGWFACMVAGLLFMICSTCKWRCLVVVAAAAVVWLHDCCFYLFRLQFLPSSLLLQLLLLPVGCCCWNENSCSQDQSNGVWPQNLKLGIWP